MNRSLLRSRLAFCFTLLLALPVIAQGATIDFQVLLDVDNNASTGCTVGGLAGVEQVIVTSVTTTETTGSVTSMSRRVCTGGTLGVPLDLDTTGWGIGFNPNSGQMVVESRVSYAALGGGPFTMRIGFVAQTGTTVSSVLTRPNGQPILFPEAAHGRRRSATPGNLDERVFALDGQTHDWGMIPPLGNNSAPGQQLFRLSQVYGYGDGQFFWFRADANLSKNPPPQANDDAYSVRQGQVLVIANPGVLANDIDPTGQPLTAVVVTKPSHGVLTLNAQGGFTYANDGVFVASDFFEYRATNGSQESNTAKVVITILPNGLPQAVNDAYNVAHRGTLTVPAPGVLTNDSDPDGDPLTAFGLTNPANGTLVLNTNGAFTYTHNGTNTLADSFTYAARDGLSQSSPATVNITVAADIPPTAVNDAYSVNEGATLNVAAPGIFSNDTDPDTPQSLWTAQVVTPPANGTLTMGAGGAFRYVHNGSETTSDSFVYRVNDGIANSANATVTITINPSNDAPVATGDSYTTDEDVAINVAAAGVLANDTDIDPGTTLTAVVVTHPSHGQLTLGANGSIQYVPAQDFNGTDSFTYKASDGTADSNAATVTLTINAVNDAPVGNVDVYGTLPGQSITISPQQGVLANDIDVEGDPLVAVILTSPSHGTITFNSDGGFTYVPDPAYIGIDSFTYQVEEATVVARTRLRSEAVGAPTTVSINIHATNAAPVANALSRSTSEDNPVALVLTGSDPDFDAISFSVATSPAHGTLVGTVPNLTYLPARDYNGADSFTFSVSDGFATTQATVSLTITPVNDAPLAVNDNYGLLVGNTLTTTAVNGTVANDTDVDGDTLTATRHANVLFGSLTFNAAGTFTYTPNAGFLGTDSFTYSVTDGNGGTSNRAIVTINVRNTNAVPVATAATVATGEEVALGITLTGTDADGDTLSFRVVSGAANGTLRVIGNIVVYIPNPNFAGTDTFTFEATDGIATSAPATMTINVLPVNDAPVNNVPAIPASTPEDTLLAVAGISITDVDSGSSAIEVSLSTTRGTMSLPTAGLTFSSGNSGTAAMTFQGTLSAVNTALAGLSFAPNADYNGNASIQMVTNDLGNSGSGGAKSDSNVRFIIVTPVNDAPAFTKGPDQTVNEDAAAQTVNPWATAMIAGPADEAGQTFSFNLTNNNNALFSVQPAVSPTGVLTYTPAANANGVATVTITVSDNGSNVAPNVNTSAAQTFTITINAVNDVPVNTVPAAQNINEDVPLVFSTGSGNAISVADVDAATAPFRATLTATNGTLTAATGSGATLTGNGTASLVIDGTLAQINAALNGMTFTPTANFSGAASVQIVSSDLGATGSGGTLTDTDSVTINIAAVNDAPFFTPGPNVTVNEDSGAYNAGWATGINPGGGADEAGQTLTFNVTNNNNALFTGGGQPAIAANGTLTFTLAANAFGTATVTVSLSDNGVPPAISVSVQFTITVNAVNDAPVVATSGGTTAFVEDAGAVVVDAGLTITDIDSTTLVGATVTITNVLDAGLETLAANVGATGIVASYNAGTGVLTLSNAASLADYQNVLRSVTYNNTSNNPNATNRVIAFQVNDGGAVNNLSNIANKTVSVAGTNDAPVVTTSGGTTTFTEDAGAVVVDNALTVADVDSANLMSATVTISNLLDGAAEVLAANVGATGITQSYNAGTGVLTLTHATGAPVADWQTVLRTVTYNNASNNPNTTPRTIAFQVNDGAGVNNLSNVANKSVSITPVNDAPVVTTTGGTTAFVEDAGPVAVDGGLTITDIDSTTLASATITITNILNVGAETLAAPTLLAGVTANYAAPTLTLTGTASLADYQTMLRAVTYINTNNAPNVTNRVIAFQVNDGGAVNNLSNVANKTVSVTPTNDAPVVTTSVGTTAFTEDAGAVVVDNALTVTDVDSANLASATVTITNLLDAGQEVLAANVGATGITQSYNAGTGVLTLTHATGAPIADWQTVLRTVTYNNASNNPTTTARTIAFQVNDGGAVNNLSNVANKSVSVTPTNDAPVVTTSGGTTAFVEDAGAVVVDGGLTITDIDSLNLTGATVTITNVLDAGVETLAATVGATGINASYNSGTGVLTLTHATGTSLANWQTVLRSVTYNNTSNTPNVTNRTIAFQVNDGGAVNNLSNVANKTVSVTPTNDAPVVTTSVGTTAFTEDAGAVVIDNALTVADVDSANLMSATVTITNLSDGASEVLAANVGATGITQSYNNGTGVLTLTHATGAPVADFQTVLRTVTYNNSSNNPNTTTRTIAFQVNDGGAVNNLSNIANKSVSVTPSNDAPVVTTTVGTTAFTEDAGAVVIDGGLTVTDIDSTTLTGATVTITNVLDAGVETLAANVGATGILASYNAGTGVLTLSNAASLADYQTVLRSVTYNNTSNTPNVTNRVIAFQVNDGGAVNNLSNVANKTVSVTATNDAPVVTTSVGTTGFTEDAGAVVVDNALTVTDVDSANLMSATVTITNLLDGVAEVLAANVGATGITQSYNNGTGVLTLTHATGAPVADFQTVLRTVTYNNTSNNPNTTPRTIAFQVNDGGAVNNLSNIANKSVSVTPSNDAPVVTTTVGTTAFTEDAGAVVIDGGLTVTDIDSTTLTGATVTITNVLDAGVETLAANVGATGILASYNAGTGVLTLSNAASLADYQTVLRSVTYNNTSNTPNVTNRVIAFQVNDGGAVNNLSNVANKTVSVTPTNDAPVVTTSVGTTGFTEDAGAVVIDNALTVTDVDSANLMSATVTITNLLDGVAEALAANVGATGITQSYNNGTGVLTLTHATGAPVADFQTVLRTVTYNNTSNNPNTTARTIAFQVNDGGAVNNLSNIANKSVSITPVNDAPVVTTTGGTTAFIEDGAAVVIDGGLTITDIDSTTLTGATVTITNVLDAGVETLAANVGATGILASYNSGTGVLTLSNAASIADYQTVLRTVTYNNTSNTPNVTNRVIAFQVNDGGAVNNLSNVANKTVSVTPTNDAPVVTTSVGTTGFTEDAGAVVIDNALTVTDVDSANLMSATVTITNLSDGVAEVLAANVGATGITQSYNNGTGVLTLTHATGAPVADFQTVLRTVTYNNTSNNPNTTTRTIAFQVNDGGAVNNLSNVANKSVSVTPSNDAPVVTTTVGTTAFTEDGAAVVIDGGLTVTDIDSTTLTGATVTITNVLDAGVETLAANVGATGILASYNSGTGVLTLSNAASIADYQTVLRTVTYNNTSNTPNVTNRVIAFQVNDGGAVNNLSNVANKTVSVTPTNDAPVVTLTAGTVTFTEGGGAVVVDNALTVTDVDSANLMSATVMITNLQNGALESLSANVGATGIVANYTAGTGVLSLTHATGAPVSDFQTVLRTVAYNNTSTSPNTTTRNIQFQVNDGGAVNNLSNTPSRGVVVISVNSQPVVTTSGGTTAFVENGAPVAVDNALTVTDPDTPTLISATVTISNLLDGAAEVLAATVGATGITQSYNNGTGVLTLTHATGAPLADWQTVLRTVTYNNTSDTPNVTNRTITFVVNDGDSSNNLSAPATKTVSVAATNDAPVVTTSVGTTGFTEDGGAVVVDANVTVTDPDSPNLMSATVTITNLLDGVAEVLVANVGATGITQSYNNGTGVLTLTHATGAPVADFQTVLRTVTYNNTSQAPNPTSRVLAFVANDGALNSVASNKTVTVTSVNDAPVVTTSVGTTAFTEDAAPAVIDNALTVSDVDSPNLMSATVTITNVLDGASEVLAANVGATGITQSYNSGTGVLTLTHATGAPVADWQTVLRTVTYNNTSNTPNVTNRTIAFQVNDGVANSNIANKTVSVAAANDAPTVTTSVGTSGFTEDGGPIVVDGTVTVTDPDSPNLMSATVTITNLLDGVAEVLAANVGATGIVASYNSGTGALSLTHGTGAPVADFQTVLRTVTYNNTSQNPTTTSRVISFVANDGAATSVAANKTVTITAVNDAPVVTTTGGTTPFAEDGGPVAIDNLLTVTDADSPNLMSATVTITNLLNGVSEVLAATVGATGITQSYNSGTGVLTLTHATGAPVADWQTVLRTVTYNNTSQDPNTTTRVINFQVNDGAAVNNLSNVAAKNVSVSATNDPPTPNAAGPFNAQAGMKVTFPAGTLGGTDVEPGTTVTVNTTPGTVTNGTVTLFADGSFEFTPTPASAGGTASFQYNVCDNGNPGPGVCSSAPATVTLNVAGPAIYFVTTGGAGTACTVPQPCTLATAVAQIAATANRKIFIMDNGNHNAAVPLNSQGWLIGQAVTGASFDAVFSINPAAVAPGTLAARPAINAAAPTVQQTVSLNASTVVRGLAITTTTAIAMNDQQVGTFASPTVNETSLSATGFAALDLSTITAASLAFTSINGNGGANAILLNNVAGTFSSNGGTLQNTTDRAIVLQTTGSLSTSLSNMTLNTTNTIGLWGSTFGTLTVANFSAGAAQQAISLNTGTLNGTFSAVNCAGGGNQTPVFLQAVAGNFTVSGGALSDSGAVNTVMHVVGGTATIVWSGGLTQPNNAALVDISGTNTGNITFNTGTLNATAGTGLVFAAANGTYAFNGTTTLNGLTNGITIGTSTGSFTFGSGVAITNTTGTAVSINGTQPVVLFSGTINQTTAQKAVVITGVTGGSTAGVATPNSIRFNGTISKTTNAANAVDINGNTGGNFGFLGTLTFTTSTANAINHSGNSGTTTSFAAPAITTTTGHGLNFVNGGTVSIGGTIGTGAGNGVNGTTFTGTLSLNGTAITTGGGTGITLAGGAGTLQTTASSSINAAGQALVLNGTTLGTCAFGTLTSSAGANGISLTNVTGGTLTGSAGSLTGNSSHAFNVSGGTATVTYAGTITQNTASQRAINITGITGGTLTFSGPINSNGGAGASIAGTGGTVDITGAMTFNNTGAVFTVSGAGLTIKATNANNIVGNVTAATGPGVSISNSTIGTGGVIFRKVAVTGGVNGIVLNTTGSTAGFSVTGDGSTLGSGGTIQNTSASGVLATSTQSLSLNFMNLTNANNATDGGGVGVCDLAVVSGCNGAVDLTSVTGATLNRMTINGGVENGVVGSTVEGLTISNTTVQNFGDGASENGVYILGLYGTVSVTNSTFTGNFANNFGILNTAAGPSALTMTVTGSTFSSNGASGEDGFLYDGRSGTNATLTVTGNTFTANRGDHFQTALSGSAIANVTFGTQASPNTLTGGHAFALGQSIATRVGGNFSGTFTFDINGNTLNGAISTAINTGSGSMNGGTINGKIRNNTVGTTGVALSGSSQGDCILAETNGTGSPGVYNVLITGNILKRCFDRGIYVLAARDTAASPVNATITSNDVNELSNAASRNAIYFETGSSLATETATVCADISSNVLFAATAGDEFRIRQRSNVQIRMPGYGGTLTSDANVKSYIEGRNTSGGTALVDHTFASAFANTPSGNPCTQP